MQFNVAERLLLLNILPKEGSYTTIKLVRKLRESLSFTEAEHEELGIQEETGRVTWKNDSIKDVHIGPKVRSIVEDALKDLDAKGKLNEDYLSLYEKFLGSEEDD